MIVCRNISFLGSTDLSCHRYDDSEHALVDEDGVKYYYFCHHIFSYFCRFPGLDYYQPRLTRPPVRTSEHATHMNRHPSAAHDTAIEVAEANITRSVSDVMFVHAHTSQWEEKDTSGDITPHVLPRHGIDEGEEEEETQQENEVRWYIIMDEMFDIYLLRYDWPLKLGNVSNSKEI